jgi:3'-phosphoadenosine 5'-phosphosulfate sulfotransferase (PAPS reductase)/FAD synthetase
MSDMKDSRILCQFSCGAASAVATKLTIAQYGERCAVLNAYIESEHADNRRFAVDCEKWFGIPIKVFRDDRFGASIFNVFEGVGYIKGPRGAACTQRLKSGLLRKFEHTDDVLVLGYTAEEQRRLDRFVSNWPGRKVIAPLIERGLTKDDCKAMIEQAGIMLPKMYRLGYDNANCIGCVKGGQGYFRAIREDFPDEFWRLSKVEEKLAAIHGENAYILRHTSGPMKGKRFPLSALPDGKARRNESLPSCDLFCEAAEREYAA